MGAAERFAFVVGVLTAVCCGQDSADELYRRAAPLPAPARFQPVEVVEPSAVVYHAGRRTLLIASDEGELDEVDLNFQVVGRFPLPGDLEGLALHPVAGTLLVSAEGEGFIYEFDLELRRPIRKLVVDFTSHAWYGVLVPRATPAAIVSRLSNEIGKALADPEVRKRIVATAAEPMPSSPGEFERFLREDVARWETVIRANNVQFN